MIQFPWHQQRLTRTFKALSTATVALLATSMAASAEPPASTLDRITETGIIRIGYSADASPFSFLDADKTVVGYSIDLCGRVVEKLQQQLGLAKIEIEYVPRTPSDRVLLVQDGSIDIECVASTNNAERRKSVAFTYSHFMTATQFVTLRSQALHSVADLSGRSVASTSGTIVIGQLNTLNRERALNLAVVPTSTHEDGFELMSTGRVSAFVMDGILLASLVANAEDPDLFEISPEALDEPAPYGFMIRRDDIAFRDAVNTALQQIYAGGDIGAIYDKWFNAPIPPHGINLKLPQSEALKAAFASPANITD